MGRDMKQLFRKWRTLESIYNELDDESKKIFEIKMNYFLDRNIDKEEEELRKVINIEDNRDLHEFFLQLDESKVIIFGAGKEGVYASNLLGKFGICVKFFCDNDKQKQNTLINNIPVISVEELCQRYKDYTVILISPLYAEIFVKQLVDNFFPWKNILLPRFGKIVLSCGKQYFDCPYIQPVEDEVFIDAGGFDGQTVLDYIAWSGGKYKKVYTFEPNPFSIKSMKERLKDIERIEIIGKGTWSESGNLCFTQNGMGSKVNTGTYEENAQNRVEVISIDEVLKKAGEKKIGYIKMDVEGAELQSLEGAKESIVHSKPRLAISIYHKAEDLLTISTYLKELVPEYKFCIRHYSNYHWETVLYAYV